MAAGAAAGFVTAFLQTKMGVPSILAGIITNTGLYTINLMAMGWTSTASLLRQDTIFRMFQATGIGGAWSEILLGGVLTVGGGPAAGGFPGDPAGPVHPSHGGQSGHGQGLLHQPKLHHHRGAVHRQRPHCLFRRSGGSVPAQRQRKHRHRNGGHRLACLIIGETVLGRGSMLRGALSVFVGSILYRIIYAAALSSRIIEAMKLLTAILVALAIAAPTLKQWAAFQKRKAEMRKGGR